MRRCRKRRRFPPCDRQDSQLDDFVRRGVKTYDVAWDAKSIEFLFVVCSGFCAVVGDEDDLFSFKQPEYVSVRVSLQCLR